MKRFLFFFLLLSGFSSKSFGIENYNECGVFEEIVKRDFYEYSFDEPDNAIPDRIVQLSTFPLHYYHHCHVDAKQITRLHLIIVRYH